MTIRYFKIEDRLTRSLGTNASDGRTSRTQKFLASFEFARLDPCLSGFRPESVLGSRLNRVARFRDRDRRQDVCHCRERRRDDTSFADFDPRTRSNGIDASESSVGRLVTKSGVEQSTDSRATAYQPRQRPQQRQSCRITAGPNDGEFDLAPVLRVDLDRIAEIRVRV